MSSPSFDPSTIRELAIILNDTGLSEIEIAEGDRRIRIRRDPPALLSQLSPAPLPVAAPPPAAAPPSPPPPAPDEDPARHPGAVLSPMVGIVYLSPEPEAPPFVTVGQQVSVGQTLLLIEAMKTFNQIKANKAGTVRRILVSSGAPVEFGEPLMIID
jgi:acetyl-CoA carboxylase biotin carboxyl carrier protein